MKTIRNTNTLRKIAALLMSLVLLTVAVPSTLADSNNLTGTKWYASSFNMDLIKALDRDLYNEVMTIASLVSFVPYVYMLDKPSFISICCTIDFYDDGYFYISMLCSEMGKTDYSSYQAYEGTWSKSGNMVHMTVDGDSIYANCSNGVLSLTVNGFGLDFVKI